MKLWWNFHELMNMLNDPENATWQTVSCEFQLIHCILWNALAIYWQARIKKIFTLFAPFSTFFWISFLDFSSFLLFSARHPFRFLTSWHERDFKCVTSSPLMMCVPVDTFLKCNPENDPNWPSSPDLGTESFCPFLVLMLLIVFFVLYVLLCRFSHESFKTHHKYL